MDDRPVGTVTPPPRTPPPPDAELDSSESTPRPRRGSRGSFYMAPRLAASAPPVPLSPGLSSVQARHPKALEGHEELLPEALASGRLQGLGSGDSGSRYDVAPNPPTMVPVAISAVSLSLVKPEDYHERVQLTQTQIDLDPLESHLAHMPQLVCIQRIWRGCTARTQVRQFIEYNYAKPCLAEARKHAFRQVKKREDGRPFELNAPLNEFRAFGEAVDAYMHFVYRCTYLFLLLALLSLTSVLNNLEGHDMGDQLSLITALSLGNTDTLRTSDAVLEFVIVGVLIRFLSFALIRTLALTLTLALSQTLTLTLTLALALTLTLTLGSSSSPVGSSSQRPMPRASSSARPQTSPSCSQASSVRVKG